MLLLRKEGGSVWVKTVYRGAEIELEVNPANPEYFDRIRKKHTKYSFVKDPDTKQMVKIPETDNEAVANDMAEYLIKSFRGIGYTPDEPLDVTRDNKIMVAFMAP